MRALLLTALLLTGPAWARPQEAPAAPRAPVAEEVPSLPTPPQELPLPESLQRALEATVRSDLSHGSTAGLSVGVLLGPQLWMQGFGRRNLARRLPATPRTTYRVASITKSFTAVATLQLVEQGRIALEADIRTLVPSYPEKQWPVTVRHLLAHLSGVPTYANVHEADNVRRLSTEEALAAFADKPLAFEPGTRFLYTTWGYNLLGAAVERASGESYGEYLQQHIFGPASMQHAALDEYRTRDEQHALGYRLVDGKLLPSQFLDVSGRFAGGGTRASVEDLLRFARAVLEHRLVSSATMGRMQTAQSTRDGKLTDYGLGFATYPVRGHYVVAHAGSQPETTALLIILPSDQAAIALITNLEEESRRLQRLSTRLTEVLLHGGQVRRAAHLSSPVDAVVYEGLSRIASYGLAYYRWATRGPGSLPEETDLPGAFTRASALLERDTISKSPQAALERVRSAHEPLAESVFIRVGVHMARTVEKAFGSEQLSASIAQGPLAFFSDYFTACETAACPKELRWSMDLHDDVNRFSAGWKRTQVPALQRTRLDEQASAEKLWSTLQKATEGQPLHPDYVDEMVRVATRYGQSGRAALQKRWLERTVALHPQSVEARLALAEAAFSAGRNKEGLKTLREASTLPEGPTLVEPRTLLKRAQRATSPRVARGLLRAALAMYPQSAELQAELSRRERAGKKAAGAH